MTQFLGESESNLDFQWRGCGESKKKRLNRPKEDQTTRLQRTKGNEYFGMMKTWSLEVGRIKIYQREGGKAGWMDWNWRDHERAHERPWEQKVAPLQPFSH